MKKKNTGPAEAGHYVLMVLFALMIGVRAQEPTPAPAKPTQMKGLAPVKYCSPSGAITRPPGRMDEPGRRSAGLKPAGSKYDCAAIRTPNTSSINRKRRAAGTSL